MMMAIEEAMDCCDNDNNDAMAMLVDFGNNNNYSSSGSNNSGAAMDYDEVMDCVENNDNTDSDEAAIVSLLMAITASHGKPWRAIAKSHGMP